MKTFLRILLIIFSTVFIFALAVLGALVIVLKGPSKSAAELMTMSLRETSALYWIPELIFSEEELAEIVEKNTIKKTDEDTDTDMIDTKTVSQEIEIFEISGATYVGDVMLIHDPARVFLGNKENGYDGSAGQNVDAIASVYGAIGGINGGGFSDPNGMGNGGIPDGFVISEGQFMYGDLNLTQLAMGFTSDNKLVVGYMTGQEAIDMGLRDCACVQDYYAPILILNGEEQEITGTGGGLNPRTAIGQTADGTVIFVTVDGRQANSLGATFGDMIKIMASYGAVNATSLDGGTSSQMYYLGEYLNTPYALTGPRLIPNAWLVRS